MTIRLDQAAVVRGLFTSRTKAASAIRAGKVYLDGKECRRPSTQVREDQHIEAEAERWVSRAAYKLLGAIEALDISIPSRILDAGASTGGFTQVCLEYGAREVYACDVGHGQLAPILRQDPRVHVREGLNIRSIDLSDLDGKPVDLVVADLSFISLRLVIEALNRVVDEQGRVLLMVKPQFEVGRERLGAMGIVRDDGDRKEAIDEVIATAERIGWRLLSQVDASISGEYGNREHFVYFGLSTGR